jgi:hypothetical protein
MATPGTAATLFCVLDMFLEDGMEEFCTISNSMTDYIFYDLSLPRKHVPRIHNFAEDTVQRYSTEDFRSRFRLNKTTFGIMLQIVAPSLTAVHEGGKEETTPNVCLVYVQSRGYAGDSQSF